MKEHIVTQGERWDWISYLYYGVSTNFEDIKNANVLTVEEYTCLYAPASRTIYIPDLPTDQTTEYTASAGLPPWEVE